MTEINTIENNNNNHNNYNNNNTINNNNNNNKNNNNININTNKNNANSNNKNGNNINVHTDINNNTKRQRVLKACMACRSKKIRCDGKEPCQNCIQTSSSCIFDSCGRKIRSDKSHKRGPTPETMNDVNQRLERLELILEKILNKITNESNESYLNDKDISQSSQKLGKAGFNFATNLNYTTTDEYVDQIVTKPNLATSENLSLGNDNQYESVTDNELKIPFSMSKIEYYGSQTIYSIISKQSIEHIESKLSPKYKHLLLPLKNIPKIVIDCINELTGTLINPPNPSPLEQIQLQKGIFPKQGLIQDMLDSFYTRFYLVNQLMPISDVKELFEIRFSDSNQRTLSISELLLMNLAISLCIPVILDAKAIHKDPELTHDFVKEPLPFSLQQISREELITIYKKSMHSCMYYYCKISAFSEGLETIRALLLFVLLLENNTILTNTSSIFTSVAIKFAHELGLHRFETFVKDSPEIAYKKRSIWWFCQYFDMEISLRSGKPPIINVSDVSTLSVYDKYTFLHQIHQGIHAGDIRNIENLKSYPNGPHKYIFYYFHQLTMLRYKSYDKLFTATKFFLPAANIIESVKELNEELFKICNTMDPLIRPYLCDDPRFTTNFYAKLFENFKVCSPEDILIFHFSFNLQIMTMNRFTTQIMIDKSQTEIFRNLAVTSARTLLMICLSLDRTKVSPNFIRWSLFYPFYAFMTVMSYSINHMENKEQTIRDIELLSEMSLKYFSFFPLERIATSISRQRDSIVDLVSRIMLRSLLEIARKKLNMKILEDDPALIVHLEEVNNMFPEVVEGNSHTSDNDNFYNFVISKAAKAPNSNDEIFHHFQESLQSKNPINHEFQLLPYEISGPELRTSSIYSFPNFFYDNGST